MSQIKFLVPGEKYKYILGLFIFAGLVLLANTGQAANLDKISFPISELDNCNSKEECRTYCDDPANLDKCLAFAEKQNLMTEAELSKARDYAKLMKSNVTFPGGAKNPAQARDYCEDPAHMEECMAFAEKHGFISKTEAAEAKKFRSVMQSGGTPGGCKSKAECESFCSTEANFDTCLEFAKKHKLVSDKEIENFKKFRETGGPGGCKSREECTTFCNNQENQNTCMEFAEKNGLASKQDIQGIKEGMGNMRAKMADHPEIKNCILGQVDSSVFEKIENGELTPTPEVGTALKECFEKFASVMQEEAQKKFGSEASSEIRDCIKNEVGEEVLNKLAQAKAPDPEKAGKVRVCYEKFNPKEDARDRSSGQFNEEGNPENAGTGMPEEVKECVAAKVGQNDLSKADPEKLDAAAKSCADAARTARPKSKDAEAERLKREYQKYGEEQKARSREVPTDYQSHPDYEEKRKEYESQREYPQQPQEGYSKPESYPNYQQPN